MHSDAVDGLQHCDGRDRNRRRSRERVWFAVRNFATREGSTEVQCDLPAEPTERLWRCERGGMRGAR